MSHNIMAAPYLLYVEDDAQSREIMSLLLVSELNIPDFEIFEDSTNFIQRVETLTRRPDVILLDIHVRPHSGFEMLEMLRNHPDYRHLPIVALTASVMNEEVTRLRQVGFNGVIAKPVDIDAFPNILQRIMRGEAFWNVIS